jgi:hypothetical protein
MTIPDDLGRKCRRIETPTAQHRAYDGAVAANRSVAHKG